MSDAKVTKDEYFKTTGILAQRAALCDTCLFIAFCVISKAPSNVCQATYYAAEAHAIRRAIVRRVAEALAAEDLKDIDQIAAATEKANKKRNELAHSTLFAGAGEKPDTQVNLRNMAQRSKPVTRAYLDSLLAESLEAYNQAGAALKRVVDRHGRPLLEPQPPSGRGSQG